MSLTNEHIWAPSPSTTRGQPTQLSCDAKGERLAYASNKSIFIRSIDDPAVARQYTEHKAQATVARFSPSGFYVASGDAAGTVKVWDCVGEGITKGDYSIVNGRINDIAWDGDSQRIIAVGDGKQRYGHCFTWDSGNSVGEIYGHTQPINSVSIRQQRPLRAAAAGDDKTLVFYHGAPFKFNTGIRDKHTNYIYGVSFSPDGSQLVSVGGDRRIWLYDGKTGESKAQIGEGEHKGSIFGVSWSKDSRKLVTASADRTVKLWDVEAGKVAQTWSFGNEGAVNPLDQQVGVVWPSGRSDGLVISLSLSGDLNYLVEGTPQPRQVLKAHQKNITSLTRFASADGKETLWSGSFEGRVRSWDVATGTADTVDGDNHTNYIAGLTATQEGKGRIYSVGWDDTLRSIDVAAKTYTGSLSKLSAQPKGVAAAGNTVLVAQSDAIDIYQDGNKSGTFKAPADVTAVAAHEITAAFAAEDLIVRIGTVTPSAFTSQVEFKASRNPISTLAFSPDGTLLAVGDSRGRILVFRSKDGSLVTDRWTAHTSRITSIAWNSKGTHVASGSLDTHIFVWSLEKPGDWIQGNNAHKEGVTGVAWIADETKIASAGTDAAIKLREAAFILPHTGQRLKGLVNLGSRDAARDGSGEEQRPLLASSDSTTESSHRSYEMATLAEKLIEWWDKVRAFAVSEHGKGVFKFGLAYLLGSLATFIPAISAFLGHQDGKHLVATVTVYFHPARSRGSMFKALICACLAFLYTTFLSVTSMCVSMFFENLDLLVVGHIIVLTIFCGGGFAFIGWTKQRLNDPLVNVACSLASLSTTTILTKEGAVQKGDLSFAKISQTLKMLVMGVCAAMAVSFLIFPISARKKLRFSLTTMTSTLAIMLGSVTESFLTGSDEEMYTPPFTNASAQNKNTYVLLDKLVKEAKLEHYVAGTESEYRLEKRLVRCVQDINQNMGGLQSAAALQFQLLKQSQQEPANLAPDKSPLLARKSSTASQPGVWSIYGESVTLTPVREREEDDFLTEESQTTPVSALNGDQQERAMTATPSPQRMFEVFIEHLGPSMQSFAFTLKEILEEIPFGPGPEHNVSFNTKFYGSLDRALQLYREAREEALALVYRERDFAKIQSPDVEADLEEVSASCGHFSFTLMEFGEQLKDLLQILDELKLECEERPRGRTWNWLKFWRWFGEQEPDTATNDYPNLPLTNSGRPHLRKGHSSLESGYTAEIRSQNRVTYRVWKSLGFLRRDETKYAIKVGVGAALYALPSFNSVTRPLFTSWRGEWGLVSYMLVCSMTIGASNTTGYARFLGTCLGACCSIAAWYASGGNVVALAFMGWLMATWTSYITLVKGQGPMGRFIMLTYNLSVLYAYSLSANDNDNDEDEGGTHPIITEIALHRVVAVLSGCVWGIIVTRMIWPISARSKLKDGLSLLWLQMSLIWKRDPLSMMVNDKPVTPYLTVREKLQIERFLSNLETLHAAAKSEFELQGPFPELAYRNIINRTRGMLNAFYSMNMEILKNLTASEGELSLLQYTTQERVQLSSRISHLLSVLASSMKLEYPLNDALPNIQHARDRLLARIFHYRLESEVSLHTTDSDYALLYAYVLVTGQLGSEISALVAEISRLFGVLNEDVIELQ
ncbi:hypothetical protein UA08_09095 [Talaromyces atroroseus]|uniref:Uncharacterized protein n=1 Tax=Talaromyces atroroseus TaxID=1441469 RepID=A0A1Q5Q795_TALAT|nr:hypothetical protein UA08_09095 [Talaromyces atroroseus]OKL55719.1 hypothetical protein UA08_09095 [Talaromyces atroroseus]